MAKKKTQTPAEETAVTEIIETLDNTTVETLKEDIIEDIVEADAKQSIEECKSSNEANEKETVESIPDNVLRILKVFKNIPEIYVTSGGGVFTKDTEPSLRGNAILYKNPFYNLKS